MKLGTILLVMSARLKDPVAQKAENKSTLTFPGVTEYADIAMAHHTKYAPCSRQDLCRSVCSPVEYADCCLTREIHYKKVATATSSKSVTRLVL